MTLEAAYIFDVDGTLTSEEFFNDQVSDLAVNTPIMSIAQSLMRGNRERVAVVTARPFYLLQNTRKWLNKNGLSPHVLMTRKPGDIREDHDVRVDQVQAVMEVLGENVVLFDDKLTNCLNVYAKLKVPYIHVRRYGNFN